MSNFISPSKGFKSLFIKHKTVWSILFVMLFAMGAQAQVTGSVFRDFNGNGAKDANEPLVSGVTVTAYLANSATPCGTITTSGSAAPNYTLTGCGTAAVRVEFTLPTTGVCVNSGIDFTSFSGTSNATSVQFVNGNSTNVNFAIHNPSDYNKGTANVSAFIPCYVNGDPLPNGSPSGAMDWFVGFPYTSTGNTTPPTQKLNGAIIGATWGVAYSKQANKVFTSAFLKRHVGLGVMGSGGIYMLTPTANSFTVSQFYNMDANGHRTRAEASAPTYGNASSFSINATGTFVTYLGANDPLTGQPSGLGVIGANGTGGRGLPTALNGPSFDPAMFDQVGKVGLGDLEISDDGKYLFVTNLYSRLIFRLELNSATNPTSVVSVESYAIPALTVTNGVLRPFGLKYGRGKLYVGAVSSGENGGQNVVNGASDLNAYVFELDNPTGTASFNASPISSIPLNYKKGPSQTLGVGTTNASTTVDPWGEKWYPWSIK